MDDFFYRARTALVPLLLAAAHQLQHNDVGATVRLRQRGCVGSSRHQQGQHDQEHCQGAAIKLCMRVVLRLLLLAAFFALELKFVCTVYKYLWRCKWFCCHDGGAEVSV